MRRIDTPTAENNRFVNGNASQGKKGTQVSAEWLNAVQEEIAKAIEGFGVTLNSASDSQLFGVIKSTPIKKYEYSAGTITSDYNEGILDVVIPPGKVLDITIDFEGYSNFGSAGSLIVWGIVNKANNSELDSRQARFIEKDAEHSLRLVAKNETTSSITAKIAVKSEIESLSCFSNYIRGVLG